MGSWHEISISRASRRGKIPVTQALGWPSIQHNRSDPLLRALSPPSIPKPLARYSHGIAVPAGYRLVVTSGQLGIGSDAQVPADCEAQAELCFANIAAILAEDRMTLADVVRLNAYVTGREHMQGYMRARDRRCP
jgi:2-iminobutanoate/2-iminopropanoate deaminase